VALEVLDVSALRAENVRPLAAEEAVRKAPSAVIAFGFEFVSFGSAFATRNDVMVAVVRSLIVTVIS
jgi:hypothetical protein